MVPATSSLLSVAITRSICRQWQKAHDIAVVAAALGPRRRLEAGIVAVTLDQVRCVGQRRRGRG